MTDAQQQPEDVKQGISWLGLMGVILALGALGFSGWQFWYNKTQMAVIVPALKTQINAVAQTNQDQLQTLSQSLKSMQQSIASNDKDITHLLELSGRGHEDWMLLSIMQRLHMANLSLQFNNDKTTALKLLQLSDKQLANTRDAEILPLRKVLAKDIVALQSVTRVDLAGILSRLGAIQQRVVSLPLIKAKNNSLKLSHKLDGSADGWKSMLKQSLHELEKVVVVRHHGNGIKPVMTKDQSLQLKQNIIYVLEQAQWAATTNHNTVYHANLNRAQQWVAAYFDKSKTPVQAVLKDLAALNKINIKPKLPSINKSLKVLEGILHKKMKASIAWKTKAPKLEAPAKQEGK